MKLYLYMVLSGSICTLLYIFINYLLNYELSIRFKNIFLKINMIFYLLPIPWLVAQIKDIIRFLLNKVGIDYVFLNNKYINYPNTIWESMIIRSENIGFIYITGYQKFLFLILAVIIIFLILLLNWIFKYVILKSQINKETVYLDTGKYFRGIDMGKRKIKIGFSPQIDSPVTIGIMKPVILLPADKEKYINSEKAIVVHEIKHILNKDAIFRFLTVLIIAMEWYNPLVYFLLQENIAVSEVLCDEAATEYMLKEEKVSYMRCMIAFSEKPKKTATMMINFGTRKGLCKERMMRIMGKNKKKIMKNSIALIIMIICFIFSSIPALAYQVPKKVTYSQNINITDRDWDKVDIVEFTQGSGIILTNNIEMDFSVSDFTFINETGEIYFYEDAEKINKQEKLVCSHDYVSGTYSEHEKYSNGGCKIISYNAKRCKRCGDVILGTEISTLTYNSCPHS